MDRYSFRNRLSDFVSSFSTQIRAALAVGLPQDTSRSGNLEVGRQSDAERIRELAGAGDPARRHRDDAPGYMTRNGLGSLEVGAFRDRTDE